MAQLGVLGFILQPNLQILFKSGVVLLTYQLAKNK